MNLIGELWKTTLAMLDMANYDYFLTLVLSVNEMTLAPCNQYMSLKLGLNSLQLTTEIWADRHCCNYMSTTILRRE